MYVRVKTHFNEKTSKSLGQLDFTSNFVENRLSHFKFHYFKFQFDTFSKILNTSKIYHKK